MRSTVADDAEASWLALFCFGVLITALSSTVCLGLIAFYAARPADLHSVLACVATGALVQLVAAARLDLLSTQRTNAGPLKPSR